MNSNKQKINLVPYFNKSWHIQLDETFKLKLKELIKDQLTIEELSKLTGKSKDSIWKFNQGRSNANFDYLLKICNLLNIPNEALVDNIVKIYPNAKKACIRIKELEIDSFFAEWYAMWIGEGDHSSKRKAISLSNYSLEMLKFHIDMLLRLKFKKDRIKAEIISPYKDKKTKIKKRWSKLLDLPINQITSVSYMENATQEGARVGVFCTVLFRILHEADSKIKSLIKNSDNKIKIAYIKGIFAAEGSIRKKAKQIRLNMKDKDEVFFIKDILEDLHIKPMPIKFNKCNKCYELSIFSYDNIKRFKDIGGFGLNKKRTKLLEENFKTYENRVPFHVRTEKVKEILLEKREICNNELAKLLNRYPDNIAWITRRLNNEGILNVDKSNKIYKYSLVDVFLYYY